MKDVQEYYIVSEPLAAVVRMSLDSSEVPVLWRQPTKVNKVGNSEKKSEISKININCSITPSMDL